MPDAPWILEFTRVDDAGDPYAVRRGRQRYLLRVGEGRYAELELDWSEAMLRELAEARRGRAAARAVGRRLGALLEGAKGLALEGLPSEVVVRSAAAELYALPWELALIGAEEEPLGARAPLRYGWPGVAPAPLQIGTPAHPGRALLAWSEAGGGVPHAEHQRLIEEAWARSGLPGGPEVLPDASLERLEERLWAKAPPVRVLQLLCHGRQGPQGATVTMGTPERPDAVSAERLRHLIQRHVGQIRLVVLTVCESADASAMGDAASLARALHLAGVEAVIGARAPLSFADAAVLTEATWGALCGMRTAAQGLAEARDALRLSSPSQAWAQLQLYAAAPGTRALQHRPYRGLIGHGRRDAPLFFGRDQEVAQLLRRVQAARAGEGPKWLFVSGPSGSGKSSMIRAGLMPAVLREADDRWSIADIRPGEPLPEAPEGGALLLLVDQLEEVFTRIAEPSEREAFVRAVDRLLLAEGGRVVAVGTLRSDYLERCREIDLDDGGFDERVFDPGALLQLTPLGRAALQEVVRGPAEVVGVTLEAGLVEEVTAQVAGEPGALPLVAHAMDALWLRRDGLDLTLGALRELGGAVGALASSADGVLRRMSEAERAEARRLLVSMVRVEEDGPISRQVARLEELDTGERERDLALSRAAMALVQARLLILGADAKGPALEIAHEALLRRWGWLRAQIEEHRQLGVELERLADWHREHQRQVSLGRPSAGLLRGPQLHLGQALLESHPDRVPRSLRAFVERSAVAAAADLRRRRYDPLAAFVGLLFVACFVNLREAELAVQLPLAVVVSLVAWARWAVFSELRARYDIEGFLQAVMQAALLVALSARGFHDELADWDTALFMGLGVLGMLGMVIRLMRRAVLPDAVTKAGILGAAGLWLLAALAWQDPAQGGDLRGFTLFALAAGAVEGGTWFGLVGKRLPPTSDASQLWRILRDGQTFSALAALMFLFFIYGGSDNGAHWRELNTGLSVAVLALALTINSLGSLGRERGDGASRIRVWHIGQSMVALGMVNMTLGFAHLIDLQRATSLEGRWMAGLGLVAFIVGVNLRRPVVHTVVPLRDWVVGGVAICAALWPWVGAGLATWTWLTPLVVVASISVIIAHVDVGVEGEDSWRAPSRRDDEGASRPGDAA